MTTRLSPSLSLDATAELLEVSRRTIYNMIRDGRLQTMRTIGGSLRVLRASLPARVTQSVIDRSAHSEVVSQ